MLYIFRVDTGAMVTLDMGLALETVAHLKVAVETNCGIPQEKQVLLISGADLSLDTCLVISLVHIIRWRVTRDRGEGV